MNGPKSPTTQNAPFDAHAAQTLGHLQRAFEAIAHALPDPIGRASDLQHALKLDKVLSWRIFNVMRSADPFVAARYVPGMSAVESFLRAARKSGVPAEVTVAAEEAVADFENLVTVHAGDRKRLDMLLASLSEEGRAEADTSYRRTAYQANSYLWGVSAAVSLVTHFAGFSKTPGMLDGAGLRGFVGLQRIRPSIRLPVAKARVWSDEGKLRGGLAIEPFYDLADPPQEVLGLLMSTPPPKIERVDLPDGLVRYDLLPGPVGKTASTTCLATGVVRNVGTAEASSDDACMGFRAEVNTPAELLVFDQFIDERIAGRLQPELFVHSLLHGDNFDESERLPVQETIRYMGKASGVLHTPEIPRYGEMARYVLDKLEWDASRFDVYRFRWEFPIMPSIVTMRSPLPPAK